jgi:uncharacterized protein YggE
MWRPVVIMLAPLAAALAGSASAQEPPSPAGAAVPSIVTTGDAVIRRAPDQAFIVAAVETRARDSKEAQRQNAQAMTAVQQRLADERVPKDAVRTIGYSVQPDIDFSNGRRNVRGFIARNGVEIRLDAIERAGEILDAVVQAGATSVDGVRFELKDRSAVEREALRMAVVDARARADAMAAGAGRTVDRILRIEDGRPPQVVPMMRMAPQLAETAAAPTPIEPSTIEIRAQVTLTVAIK